MKITKRFSIKRTLAWEIFFALLFKGALLFLLWWTFFSHAPSKDVIAATVAERISGSAHDFSLIPRSEP
ncbi:hypothetical protein OYT1_ch0985 [Ferriphaselus amnicola]|uniref:Uncharacterized protein n=1 Tax=Ferriphaselus amnicola TaxID=1188319 RepID=A0A2Z6GAU4_9PROT|nr:cytochrome oxidase putative small subunit CydP [Ferriphaselus amnicola]BBE50546.1 hypothetical protein OYT1_ch0985 [Ferriphaselus amnicola]